MVKHINLSDTDGRGPERVIVRLAFALAEYRPAILLLLRHSLESNESQPDSGGALRRARVRELPREVRSGAARSFVAKEDVRVAVENVALRIIGLGGFQPPFLLP